MFAQMIRPAMRLPPAPDAEKPARRGPTQRRPAHERVAPSTEHRTDTSCLSANAEGVASAECAANVPARTAPAAPAPAAPGMRGRSGICAVKTPPSYTPSTVVPVTMVNGRKRARFDMAASFVTDPGAGKAPGACSVLQLIRWDDAFRRSKGAPPHTSFPDVSNSWIEDRTEGDAFRYGHRSGPWAIPVIGGNEYTTNGRRDMLHGDTYSGNDAPGVGPNVNGQWQFQLVVMDTDTSAYVAGSPVLVINW